MGKTKSPLFDLLDSNKSKMFGKTEKKPCIWCDTYVDCRQIARIRVHFLHKCKKVPRDRREEVTAWAQTPKKKQTAVIYVPRDNNASNQNNVFNNNLITPSKAVAKSVSKLNIKTPANPSKKRKLSSCGTDNLYHQSDLLSHFVRPMNDLNAEVAVSLILNWLLALGLNKEMCLKIINEEFDEFLKFICPSLMEKYDKELLFKNTTLLKGQLKFKIFNKLRGSSGCLGINLYESLIEIYVLDNRNIFFLNDIPKIKFVTDENKEEEKSKSAIECIIDELNSVEFKLFGIKASSSANNNAKVLATIKKLSKDKQIMIVSNLVHLFDEFIDNLLQTPCVAEPMRKIQVIINVIDKFDDLKKQLEDHTKISYSDNILDQIHIICKSKSAIKTFISDLEDKRNSDANAFISDLEDNEVNDESLNELSKILFDRPFFIESNHINDCLFNLRCLRDILDGSNVSDDSMSNCYNSWYKSVFFYEKTIDSPLFNRYDYKNDKFEEKLINGLKTLIASNGHGNVFDGTTALYVLSGLINPNFDCRASLEEVDQTDQLLSAWNTLDKYNEFKPLLVKATRNRYPFEKDKWTCWDKLAGTREYHDFGIFGEQITSISGKSLDVILKDIKERDFLEKFCGLNKKLEKNKFNNLK